MPVRIHPLRNLAPDHLKMVLVSLGLHLVLWALILALPRVPVTKPRLGQNSLSEAYACSVSSSVSLVA